MFRSSETDRYDSKSKSSSGCCCIQQYEDQIAILQGKLMETHKNLILQLDVCQEQQLTIIELTKKIMHLEGQSLVQGQESVSFSSSRCDADISKQSNEISKACFYQNRNCEFTLNNSNQLLMSNYNSPTFIENNRNQLLKADLEVMRVKLLEQATQKTALKEELDQLKALYNQKMNEYKKKIKDLENDHEFLLKQYDYIKISLEKGSLKKNNQKSSSSPQFVEINQKCLEFERLYKKQVILNQEMNQKITDLKSFVSTQKQKIKALEDQVNRYAHSVKSHSTAADGLKDQRDREQMCGTIRTAKNPGALWEKDSNKRSKISQNVANVTNMDLFKKRNTLSDGNYLKQKPNQLFKQNKQNIHDSIQSVKSSAKQKHVKVTKKDEYQSTKELIKKLEQTEMITRQRKRTILG